MTGQRDIGFAGLLDRLDRFLADDAAIPHGQVMAMAASHIADAEDILIAWLTAREGDPTQGTVEGFRLLALHRQGARGNPGFNACRETCREIIYLSNLIALLDEDPALARHHLRLQAMVLRHLALFIGGKLEETGLGEFCCSSRPVRMAGAAVETRSPAERAFE